MVVSLIYLMGVQCTVQDIHMQLSRYCIYIYIIHIYICIYIIHHIYIYIMPSMNVNERFC